MNTKRHMPTAPSPKARVLSARGALPGKLLVLVFMVGCSSDRVPVGGSVTLDGAPVADGVISFEPADGQGPTTGGKIANGIYELAGAAAPLPGEKKVRISAGRKTGRRVPAGPPAPPDAIVDEVERYIPDIYNKQTTLVCEVLRDGSRQIDFHLKSQ